MITYDELLMEADENNLITKEKPLRANKGRIKGNKIAIKQDMTETQKKCVLAEELGHYYTAVGTILDQANTVNRKLERRGRILAYNRLVGLTGIVEAYKHNCQSIAESAEYLGVTVGFLNDTLSYYKSKYGTYTTLDHYCIIFEPSVAVLELV